MCKGGKGVSDHPYTVPPFPNSSDWEIVVVVLRRRSLCCGGLGQWRRGVDWGGTERDTEDETNRRVGKEGETERVGEGGEEFRVEG